LQRRLNAAPKVEERPSEALFICAEPPPEVEEGPAEVAEGEPKPESAAPPEPKPSSGGLWPYFAEAGQDHDVNPALIRREAALDNARSFSRRKCWAKGQLAAVRWHGEFWRWDGRVWRVWPAAEVHSAISRFLDQSETIELNRAKGTFERVRFIPKTKDAADLLTFLQDGLAIDEAVDPPMWFDTGTSAGNVVAFRNAIVDVVTAEEVEPRPALWIHNGVGYDWVPEARCPTWEKFLREVFPDDGESQACVEEMLGLAMTEDLSFEKGLMLIGPTRSGKSTITGIAAELVGTTAYASLDANKWVSKDTSSEVLIGKRLGVFEDMRLRRGRWFGQSYDPGGLDHVSVELMLKLTAGNRVTLARKWIKDWEGVVPIHLWIVSNEVPVLNDPVLPDRFVKLAFGQSFLGREDVGLKARLRGELPGIAQRALAAYRRAKGEGRLIQPAAGLALKAEVDAGADAFGAWFGEWLIIDPNGRARCGEVFTMFQSWCGRTGNSSLLKDIPDGTKLTKRLKKVPGLAALRTTTNSPREYVGLRLKTREERKA
jgi:putative DNA primase/helicase